MRRIVFVILISSLSLITGCGGGSSSSSNSSTGGGTGGTSSAGGNTIVTSGNNVAPLVVDAGPAPSNPVANVAFTTVMICVPQTANCVTIDHVAVDTGSIGLRIPVTAFSAFSNGPAVLAALQNVNTSAPVAECVQFLDNSFFFGSVRSADVKMGGSSNTGEVASSVPIHVMGDTSVPTGGACTGIEEDTVTTLGANGLLGVGNFQYDCDVLGFGNPCTSSSTLPSSSILYYTCSTSTSCGGQVAVPTTQQVRNPVSLFTAVNNGLPDNNGVILELPAVPVGGQTDIPAGQGSLVFGIGTQSNNGLSSSTVVLALDSNLNDAAWSGVTTVFNGKSYPNSTAVGFGSFLDSGTNTLMFLDQPTSGIPSCGDFYCPSSTETLTAVNQVTSGNSRGVQFNVSNANTLNGSFSAFSDLASPNTPGSPDSATQAADGFFDWGLPFFYGRNVYTSIWQVAPPATPASGGSVPAGPFWAY